MVRFIAACAIVAACLSPAAAQDKRVALVIGNAEYRYAPPMRTPVNDAADVSTTLTRMGFAVTALTNRTREQMDSAIAEFSGRAASADIAIIFLGGRAIRSDSVQWLIPVDGRLDSLAAAIGSAVKLDRLVDALARVREFGAVFVDTARDNPFPETEEQRRKPVKLDDPISLPGNVIIGFATVPGGTLAEPTGRNSAFTTALLKQLEVPGLDINVMMRRVRAEVFKTTAGKQIPWAYVTAKGDHYLTPP